MRDKPFITCNAPEIALVLWRVRAHPTTRMIGDEPGMVCDLCNEKLDWEPFAVVDWPNDEELSDLAYDPIGSYALCQSCARKFYTLTKNDINEVDRLWFFYAAKRPKIRNK